MKPQKIIKKEISKFEELDCYDKSHNEDNCLNDKTKLVIIGTITPKDFGYFYCAPRNRIYGYIDEAIGTNLKELKEKLNNALTEDEKHKIKNDIIKVLKENKIAFVDVMDCLVRDENKIDSHYDDDIKFYCVDEETLSKVKTETAICNSRLAQKVFCDSKGIDIDDKYYLPQRGKGSSKQNWLDEIRRKLCVKK